MIPIRDTLRTETYPLVNYLIIFVNISVFLLELTQGKRLPEFILVYGLVPARYSIPDISAYFSTTQQILSFGTFMFLHGGILHLLGNMWFLYIFGDNVEDRLGHLRYLGFYLLCGVASGASHLVLNIHSQIPTIGASGAIAGVMGAYFLLHPRAKVLTLVPIIFFFYFVEVPAFLFLGIWLLFQFLSAGGPETQTGGIAWWAHIGGFLFGMLFLKLFRMIPSTGIQRRARDLTRKHSSPRLQVIRTRNYGQDPHLYGFINVTAREARLGARKLISVRWGLREKTLFLTVPPGLAQGSTLRLRNLGRVLPGGRRGDLYLKVQIQD